ncbi:MAG: bifunctional phosphoribosylaminoimidazolecarboxamide formyltransferase/IMP cyclohydrolase [Thermoplasmata archaeon]
MSKKALLSVYDKTGIVAFAKKLDDMGFELLSSGGTSAALEDAGMSVTKVEEVTGFPEMLNGRVKTLHPMIHGGILYEMGKHEKEVEAHGLPDIDLVAVNLYPFKDVVGKEHTLEDAVEKIDIGGVALIRAAAKNHERVVVVVSPSDYDRVVEDMEEHGEVTEGTKKLLAVEAFQHTADYDTAIYDYFQKRYVGEDFPQWYTAVGEKVQDLRYGENPNQKAAFYHTETTSESSVLKANKLHGKKLSYNNILDLDSALDMVKDFDEPTVAAVKHTNPSGIASGEDLKEAYVKAHACDPISIFGGVVAANRPIPRDMAEEMNKIFLEGVIAPGYLDGAEEVLMKKKNIRVMELETWEPEPQGVVYAKVAEGLLVQDRNFKRLNIDDVEVVSERDPTEEEMKAMEFAWKVVKHVKSNAIVFTREDHTVGIGAGQMSRVDSVKIAQMKAQSDTSGCVMASDAFFPFRDGVDAAYEAGITAVIQPGGSIRDQQVIDAINEHDMSMVFTGYRVFKH